MFNKLRLAQGYITRALKRSTLRNKISLRNIDGMAPFSGSLKTKIIKINEIKIRTTLELKMRTFLSKTMKFIHDVCKKVILLNLKNEMHNYLLSSGKFKRKNKF